MTTSKLFFFFSISFILGIIVNIPFYSMLFLLILSSFCIFIFYKKRRVFFLGLFILFFILGSLRYNLAEEYFPDEKEIIVKGTILSEPRITEKVKIFEVSGITIITDRYSHYQYGDKVLIEGILKDSSLFFPEIEKIGEEERIYRGVLSFKDNLREKINKSFNYEESMILGAIILGDKDRMGNNLKEKLNISGTRHITAISGMHIALIGIFLTIFFKAIHLSKASSFFFSIIFLSLFIIFIGAPPSAIRAGIMASVYMISKLFGRMNNASRNLFFTAAIILLINPTLIKDYSFQLSFISVFGIIHLLPLLKEKIPFLGDIFLVSLSAYIFTFPFILYNFGHLSLVSVISNLLVLPLIYFIMFFGFLFILSGFFSFLFIIPLWILLSLFIFLINFFSSFPYLEIRSIPFIFPLFLYLFLFYIIYNFNKKENCAII